MSKERIEFGKRGEERAATYLESKGFTILERNYRQPSGEIDLIARDGETLVFIEVKTRRSGSHGHPLEAVNARKQQQVCRTALHYLARNNLMETTIRFDVVALLGSTENPEISHVAGAFEAPGDW